MAALSIELPRRIADVADAVQETSCRTAASLGDAHAGRVACSISCELALLA